MSDQPLMINVSDFFVRTMHLTTGQIGIYGLLMMACATRGFVEDDDEVLAAVAKAPIREWRKVRPRIEDLFRVSGGVWMLPTETSRRPISKALALLVRRKTGETCFYCDSPFDDDPKSLRRATVDHVFPVSRGGTNEIENLVTACWQCNRSKGAMTVEEWQESKAHA